MERWDIFPSRPRLRGGSVPLCDLKERLAVHRIGPLVYFSFFRRTKTGMPFSEIKRSEDLADKFADASFRFLSRLLKDTDGWAIITTPRRRNFDGFHFSTGICRRLAALLGIPFHEGAVQCVNRQRLNPEFHLLLPFDERKVIIYDDIITTGSTLGATVALMEDREMVLNLVGINNR